MTLVLSIFPGIGLLDRAFEEEGFVVVRGPDVLWGGDVRRFHPPSGKFDGVIGGPPCQAFSALAHLVRANGYEPRFGNLIPEFERCIREAVPTWFLMENVSAAPQPCVDGYGIHSFELDNVWLGEEQRRRRRFTFGVFGTKAQDLRRWIQLVALELPRETAVLSDLRRTPVKIGGSGKVKATFRNGVQAKTLTGSDGGVSTCENSRKICTARYGLKDACRLQGLPEDFLADAPFTADAKLKAVANGVPLPMGRAVARAVKAALGRKP